jgi:hypothetical protein
MVLAGSLLFIDLLSTSPYTFGLQALSLSTLNTSLVLNLGPAESFFDQVGVAGDGSYFATVQHPGPPLDPWIPSSDCVPACVASTCCADPKTKAGYCLAVSDCSKINSGTTEWEETLSVALPTRASPSAKLSSRFNTSDCYKLAFVSADEVLCIGDQKNRSGVGVHRFNMVKQTRTLVGYFPSKFNGIWDQAAGYDPTRQVVYAYLSSNSGNDPALHAMNATTGALLSIRPWPANILMTDFAIDPASGIAYAAIANRTAGVWRKMLARLELHGASSAPITWAPVNPKCTDTFGTQSNTKCAPGTSPGAAKKCYDQLNNAFFANGQFFITAFSHVGTKSVPETVLGVNVSTGAVTLEHPHRNGNMVDMAWTPWEKSARYTGPV